MLLAELARLADVVLEAAHDLRLLGRREELAVLGEVLDEPRRDAADDKRQDALDCEDPAGIGSARGSASSVRASREPGGGWEDAQPARLAPDAVHARQAIRENAPKCPLMYRESAAGRDGRFEVTKRTRQRRRREEDGDPDVRLAALVPRDEVVACVRSVGGQRALGQDAGAKKDAQPAGGGGSASRSERSSNEGRRGRQRTAREECRLGEACTRRAKKNIRSCRCRERKEAGREGDAPRKKRAASRPA